MIDLTKKGLPNVVEINGKPYSIYTDFRIWMKFANNVRFLKKNDKLDVSYLFKNIMPSRCDISVLLDFCFPKSELPRSHRNPEEILFDYVLDADYIYAAFMSQYGIDLLEVEELHWYKFLALFKGLKDDEMICKIMGYRGYEKADNSKKDHFAELKEAWRIEYISPEEQAEIEKFSSMFD